MSDDTANGLHHLRDLHLPEPIAWWPPAPGWWILVLMFCAAAAAFLWHLVRNRTPRARARKQLNQLYADWHASGLTQNYLISTNQLLRRIAIEQQGREKVARLSGRHWVDWLDSRINTGLSSQTRLALAEQCYQAQPKITPNDVHNEIVDWITSCRWNDRA